MSAINQIKRNFLFYGGVGAVSSSLIMHSSLFKYFNNQTPHNWEEDLTFFGQRIILDLGRFLSKETLKCYSPNSPLEALALLSSTLLLGFVIGATVGAVYEIAKIALAKGKPKVKNHSYKPEINHVKPSHNKSSHHAKSPRTTNTVKQLQIKKIFVQGKNN